MNGRSPFDSTSERWADEPWHRKFQSLMTWRIREILLVSSSYDAFVLEEDGSLTDRLFYEYSELSLSWAPRLTHAASAERALELLAERRFDLVITVPNLPDDSAAGLSARIKARYDELPVVLLVFDESDPLCVAEHRLRAHIDRVFLWTGDAGVLIAAIKLLEDQRNVEHDTRAAGVRVILVVEDRVRSYSSFLALLYSELLTQAGSLIDEGLNDLHRLMRMRARPKIVLANDFHEAATLLAEHASFLCSLMTDLAIPRAGAITPDAGRELVRMARELYPGLPVLVQSAEHDGAAADLGAWFIDKNAPDFRGGVRSFLQEALGFGDFVFRLPDRTEVARARDVYELEQRLRSVPADSVAYHASRHHFSVWLRARSLFSLADRIRPRTLEDFGSVEELRADLVGALERARLSEQEGVITDLASRQTGPENRFVRIGRGSIGGKGRGVAFMSTRIVRHRLLERFDGLEIRIPKTVVLGTDAFDSFVDPLGKAELLALEDDDAITERTLAGRFSDEVRAQLRRAFDRLKGPLAVRSSSLMEDSRLSPFAGVYATYLLPNRHPDPELRFSELLDAIRAVYASTFWRSARRYLARTPHDPDDQKMAVVIQQVVGRRFEDRFYPALSGVAQSFNYYPVGAQRAQEGVAHIALGLGHTVVQGGVALRFSPGAPTVLPQFPTAASFFEGSQREFYALDLSLRRFDPRAGVDSSLRRCDLRTAERDGVLSLVGSVYSVADDVIRENLALVGPRLVTFNNILKWNSLPLAAALQGVLDLLRQSMGEEVEIEFAVDVPDLQQGGAVWRDSRPARLYLLQLRPMASISQRDLDDSFKNVDPTRLLCRTDVALGHGSYGGIRDVIDVQAKRLDAAFGLALARRISALNERLERAGRPYVLIGPGRWGSSDPTLGVPVTWADISGARVVVETPIGERRVEPSQGTHFFRNITAARVAYLTVAGGPGAELDRQWLDERWRAAGGGDDPVRHLQTAEPLTVHVHGHRGEAVIVRGRAESLPNAPQTV